MRRTLLGSPSVPVVSAAVAASGGYDLTLTFNVPMDTSVVLDSSDWLIVGSDFGPIPPAGVSWLPGNLQLEIQSVEVFNLDEDWTFNYSQGLAPVKSAAGIELASFNDKPVDVT